MVVLKAHESSTSLIFCICTAVYHFQVELAKGIEHEGRDTTLDHQGMIREYHIWQFYELDL